MDRARYILALVALIPLPPALLFWYLGHPFVGFWRRVGPTVIYVALFGMMVAVGYLVWLVRDPLLGRDLGTHAVLLGLAAIVYGAATWVQLKIRKQLTFKVLVGLPEFAPDRAPGPLMTEGMYGRVRHPRYLAVLLGYLSWAFLCNYAGLYVLWLVSIPGLYGIIRLEERELRQRYGDEHARYCERVPTLIPRLR